ncbi:radical SAM family heme chaperone HemW [Campylobacter lari]|nr:coproporphyrinogen III oxidase family protein [Campylobacter lari]EAK0494087.1 coproporphyrinogen III oxidase family protein [Campylobacter lari]EAK9999375.1 coproporphyrinogen III oxidase family protein [Campylobacter lari]EFO9447611.1 coproporphyrinogen III oxidase family protein [Campylobacter lari]HEC1753997.1 coproporphyrinogen III oxidase family protein [Campylobacter lari]
MHLYIHIPFCESKCFYCSFTSLKKKDFEKDYLNALMQDIKYQLDFFKLDKNSIKTVFVGGGTPSLMDASFYKKIFIFLQNYLQKDSEISIEANPNSSNFYWLKEIKNLGFNRISFGVQSFHEKKLQFLGRIHDQKSIFTSIENAKKAGFDNINLDLIYDTKLDDKKMLDYEISKLTLLNINHVSAYNLTIEEKTRFAKKFHFKKNAPRLAKYFIKTIENLGYKQYEISNFGQICKHNIAYWQGKDYIGCGLSAVGFLKNQRFYTKKSLKDYINDPCFREIENLNSKDLRLEHIFLGLRSIIGVDETKLEPLEREKAMFLSKKRKLVYKNGIFYNTNYLLSDELALYIST